MSKFVSYIISISLSLLFVSCEDFLYVEPDLQVSINEQLSNRQGVLEAYSGIYRDIEGLLSSKLTIYADIQGGNITFTPSNTSKLVRVPDDFENSYNFNDRFDDSNYSNLYSDLYEIINQTNLILERLDSFSFLSMEESTQMKAELLVIRGFMHYQLVIHYAQNYHFTPDASHLGVIYNRKTLTAGKDFPLRETMIQTYQFIQNDFEEALDIMTNNQLLSGPVFSYFNKINTKALYSRIALQMNDWEKARDMSSQVINSTEVSLMEGGSYVDEWEKDVEPVNEVLLEFSAPRTTNGSVSSSISEHFNYISSTNYEKYVASGDLLNMYDAVDVRYNMFIEANLTTSVNGVEIPVSYFFTKKFQGDAGTTFIRLSEMYLVRSEANARLGNISVALTDLNTIRTRANLTNITTLGIDFEEIFDERRRELAFEGHLLFDIIRFKRNVARDLGCISSVCNLSYPSNFLILPIPSESVNLNQNIQQNAGY